jgi:hypothetical protein
MYVKRISFDTNETLPSRSGPYTEATADTHRRHAGRYALATAVLDGIVLIFAVIVTFLLR